MTNPIIQTDIAEILKEIQNNQKETLKEIGDVKQAVSNLKSEVKQEISDLKSEVNKEISNLKGEVKQEISDLKGEVKALSAKVDGLDTRLKNVETSVQKIPDLAEKVGEFKWWKQTVLILSSGTVGAFIAKFLGNQNP
jgi:chromosome segregation ATPase